MGRRWADAARTGGSHAGQRSAVWRVVVVRLDHGPAPDRGVPRGDEQGVEETLAGLPNGDPGAR
jgi:hypothetical protein